MIDDSNTPAGPTRSARPTSTARAAFAVNAVVAWLGVLLTVLLSALGWYRQLPVEPGLYGENPEGAAGALGRVVDTLSYFTLWSNIVVAVSVSLLAVRPWEAGNPRRVLRLAGLLMITVTAIVYQVLLAPSAVVVGWSRLTDPILHVVTPLLTVVVWAVWGPRGWITARMVPLALVVPLTWIGWMLARGAVIDAYPYDFTNVTVLGYGPVLTTLAVVTLFSLVVAAAFWGLERLVRPGNGTVARRRRGWRFPPDPTQ